MKTRQFRKLVGIQFFADEGTGATGADGATGAADGASTEPSGSTGTTTTPATEGTTPAKESKSYTQEDLNRMMAAEKRQGKEAILRELGIDPKNKDAVAAAKTLISSQKTEVERLAEEKAASEAAKIEAEGKAVLLERKLQAIQLGVKPDSVDDVVTLAAAKTTEEKSFESVVNEMKAKYPAFFSGTESSGTGGTGSLQNPNRTPTGTQSMGERLAKSQQTAPVKSTFFS